MGLRVPDGNNLFLVGGDINMNGGGLYAFGGRVELGESSGAGTVGLNGDGNNMSLSFPNSVERSDVSFSNGARVNVTAGDGGSIGVNARNLEMRESFLLAGIGRADGQFGSGLYTSAEQNSTGDAGNLTIKTNTLLVKDGAEVSVSTFGEGKGGSLSINAQDVQLKRFASSKMLLCRVSLTQGTASRLLLDCTSFLISHRFSTVRMADAIAVLS